MAERQLAQIRRLAAPLLILLLASLTQFHQVASDRRFLPDEAFFMSFARAAAVKGDWLLPGSLDKPPLSLYFSALSVAVIGNTADASGVLQLDVYIGEFAGMLPNAFLAILLTALMMRLAPGGWAAVFAGLLTVSSPYLLAYGASAYTDMSLLFFSALALHFGLKRSWAWAGIALGLAFWSKQQAALFVPLVLLCLMAQAGRRSAFGRLALALFALFGALLIWDFARPEASVFLQAAANNAPDAWAAEPSQWLERLAAWLARAVWLLGPPLVTCLLLLGGAAASLRRIGARQVAGRSRAMEPALLLYIAGYLGAHTILRFNFYDRYLLLILPPLILLVAGWLAQLSPVARRGAVYRLGIALLLAASGLWSLHRSGPIGGDRGASAGIDALAAHLNSKPVATVIYDPWLGWELGYYLGVWHDKRRAHYPTAEALAAGALALDETGARYLVAPIDQPHDDWLAALRAVGFGAALDYERDRFIVYRLTAPPQ